LESMNYNHLAWPTFKQLYCSDCWLQHTSLLSNGTSVISVVCILK
jgi:hypothetical protein